MLIQTYKDFKDQALLGSGYSNQDLYDQINAVDPADEDWLEKVTRQVVLLALRKPIVVRQVKMLDTEWSRYMKKNLQLDKSNTMSNAIRLIDKSPINRWIISLYEQNWGYTRPLVHWLTDQTGDNKCPYIHTALRSVYKAENSNNDVNSIEDLKTFLNNPDIVTVFANYGAQLGGLKRIAGETTTNCTLYDWLLDETDINDEEVVMHDVIQNAEIAYDLGGGYATPYMSLLFKKPMVCADITDPTSAVVDPIMIKPPETMTVTSYLDLLQQQPWLEFDVNTDHFPQEYNSYFITSFGFATSTVAPPGDTQTWFDITYNAVKAIIELASIGKDVYFILYGRPTVRVHRNKIIAMRFVDKKLVHNWTYEDPYSTDSDHVFGTTYSLANDYANKGVKRRKQANKVRIKGRGGAPASGDSYDGPM